MSEALSKSYFEDLEVGMLLPTVELGPMDRFDYIPVALILRDTNPLHLDRVYAQERGLPDVVQQGPLNQAYLYRYFTSWLHDPWALVATKCALPPTYSRMMCCSAVARFSIELRSRAVAGWSTVQYGNAIRMGRPFSKARPKAACLVDNVPYLVDSHPG